MKHLQIIKIIRYFRCTVKVCICYKKSDADELITYTDRDYDGDVDDMCSCLDQLGIPGHIRSNK